MRLPRRILLAGAIGTLLMLIGTTSGQQTPSSSSSSSSSSIPSTTTSSAASMNMTPTTSSSMSSPGRNSSSVTVLSITTGPANQSVISKSTITLSVSPSAPYTGRLTWSVERARSSFGALIVDSLYGNSLPEFPTSNYRLNQNALEITSATWRDGGTYTVAFLDAGFIHASGTVVVIDSINATYSPELTANATTSNTTVNLTCTVTYGGPSVNSYDSEKTRLERTPRLSMKFGNVDLTNYSSPVTDVGSPGVSPTTITQSVSYVITPYHISNKVKLSCSVSIVNPTFQQTNDTTIQLKAETRQSAEHRFIISPIKVEYDIDDIIDCNIHLAFPQATAEWRPVNSPGNRFMAERTVPSQLVVSKELLPGQHTWVCLAIDSLNHTLEEYAFTFNVSGHHGPGWWNEDAENQKRIGLGVGLGIGIFFLILLIILVVYCCVTRRRQGKGRPPSVSKSKQPPSATTTDGYRPLDNPGSDYTPSQHQVPPPIYQPKAAAAPSNGRGAGSPAPSDQNALPLLDRSGHGDLGGSANYRPTSPAARSSSTVASSVRPNGAAADVGSNSGFADLGAVAGPPSANRSMLSHNTSVISSGASSIVDPAMQQSSRPISNRTYMGGGPRDSGRDQLVPPTSGHATGV